jgi:peptidoglycan/xylan/chitin deacetylase (PgdA/CDA1 family)
LTGYLDWDEMREMQSAGASFANHGTSHDHLTVRGPGEDENAWEARVRRDVEQAQTRLLEELGKAPLWFAYPYGEYDAALASIVKGLGYTALGQHSGAVGPRTDTRAIPRFPMAEDFAGLDDFKTKVATLPFAVSTIEPWDPLTDDRRPRLVVRLEKNGAQLDQLDCFVSGQGRVEVEWIEPSRQFAVRAAKPLPDGRSRYNCTAPDRGGKRYYWFSQQWVVRPEGSAP